MFGLVFVVDSDRLREDSRFDESTVFDVDLLRFLLESLAAVFLFDDEGIGFAAAVRCDVVPAAPGFLGVVLDDAAAVVTALWLRPVGAEPLKKTSISRSEVGGVDGMRALKPRPSPVRFFVALSLIHISEPTRPY